MSENIPAMHYFKREKSENLTHDDLLSYVNEIKNVCDHFPNEIENLKTVIDKKYDKLYAVGIGDSLYSAESIKLGFWEDTGIQMEVLESQEFNNYYLDYMPENSLVFICSGGGSAARTVESSFLAQSRAATVVAVTLSPESRLTASTENVLCFSTQKEAFIDGSRNYISLALLLKLIGIKIGVWNGNIPLDETQEKYDRILKTMEIGFQTVISNEDVLKEIMFKAKHQTKFYFLGAGPCLTLTEYGAAKFMEEAAADGICQQLEEYGHEQYWVHNRRAEGDTIFSICPAGKSAQRCAENLDEQNFLNLNTVLLTTSPIPDVLVDRAKYTIATTEFVEEKDYWMVAGNIFARLADFYTAYIGYSEKRFQTEDQFVEHYKTIHYSRFLPEVAEFDIPYPDDRTIAERGAYGLKFNSSEGEQ